MTRSKWGATVLLSVTLLLGGVIGAVAASASDWRHPDHITTCHSAAGFAGRLTKELGLTTIQADSVREIFNRHQPSMDSIWRDLRPRFDSLKKLIRVEIRTQLTPDQQKKFAELGARMDSLRSMRPWGARSENAR